MEINYEELKERAAEKSRKKREETLKHLQAQREAKERERSQFNGVLQALDNKILEDREKKQAAEIAEAEQKAAEEVRKKYEKKDDRSAWHDMLKSLKNNKAPELQNTLEEIDKRITEEKTLEERRKKYEERQKAEEAETARRRDIQRWTPYNMKEYNE